MTDAVAIILSGDVALFALAILALALRGYKAASPIIHGAALGLCLAIAGVVISSGIFDLMPLGEIRLPIGLPWQGAHFRLDNLSAFFTLIIVIAAAAASLFAIGYGAHEEEPERTLPFFPAFIAAMLLVIMAADAYAFLFAWECMSLLSWALVVSRHRFADNTRAGYVYLVMASFGTLALILAFALLGGPQADLRFVAMEGLSREPIVVAIVLVLALLGAGSKAGLVPLHAWLPLAHPAAPSHISALMSGAMTKVAVYGFIRIVFDLLGPQDWWVGIPVLVIGGGTAVLGILYALMETDLKRVLAYSTIENIGVIFAGLGLALAFRANAMGWAAALALSASLFHVANHMLFKSLLFFGAGAVQSATGHREMDRLGGLIHRMPYTSIIMLIGCVSISALPPFNGFVSEWLLFQAILQSPALPQWALKILVPAVGGLLALAAALAAGSFVRLYGIVFLSRPRSPDAEFAKETDWASLAAMYLMGGFCLLLGILPGFAIDALAPVSIEVLGDRMPLQASARWLSIVPIGESRSSYNGLLVLAFIFMSSSSAMFLIHRFASRVVRRGPAWGCGFEGTTGVAQYSATGFAQPIRRVFGSLWFAARDQVEMAEPATTQKSRFHATVKDLVWNSLYLSTANSVARIADRLNVLQSLTIRQYLSLVFAFLVLLLLGLTIW